MNIAIVGATARRDKFGNKAVRAFVENGDTVFPIHPAEKSVENLPVFASVVDVPQNLDAASFYVSPAIGLRVLEECAQKKIARVILNPGASSAEIVARASELGIEVVQTCSIRMIGRAPHQFPDE